MWFIYHCFLFVLDDQCPDSIKAAIEIMWERRETLLEKPKNKMDAISDDVKERIAPFINGHKKEFSAFTSQIAANRPQMTDDNVDRIVEECDKALDLFTSNKEMDLSQVIAKLMSADETKVRETMNNFGFSEKRIQTVIEGATAGLSNDELKNSIPNKDDGDLSHLLANK
jgi:ATP-dependent Clp protease ATP-binding subunit ClpA